MSQKDLINLLKLKISVRIKNQIGQKYEKKMGKDIHKIQNEQNTGIPII